MTQPERMNIEIHIGSASITIGDAIVLSRELANKRPFMSDNAHEANALINLIHRTDKKVKGIALDRQPYSAVNAAALVRLEKRIAG